MKLLIGKMQIKVGCLMSIKWVIENFLNNNYEQYHSKKRHYKYTDTVDNRLRVCPCCNIVWEYKIYGEKRQKSSNAKFRTYGNIPTIGKFRQYMPGNKRR